MNKGSVWESVQGLRRLAYISTNRCGADRKVRTESTLRNPLCSGKDFQKKKWQETKVTGHSNGLDWTRKFCAKSSCFRAAAKGRPCWWATVHGWRESYVGKASRIRNWPGIRSTFIPAPGRQDQSNLHHESWACHGYRETLLQKKKKKRTQN